MKRRKKPIKTVFSIFPIFWTECHHCKFEFRFKSMWRFFVVDRSVFEIPMYRKEYNVCKGCFSLLGAQAYRIEQLSVVNNNECSSPMPKCKPPKQEPTPPPEPPPVRYVNEDYP